MTNDGKKDSKLDDMSEEIAAIRRLHSECPHILDWKDTTGFTIPILNVAVALADYALDKDARIAELEGLEDAVIGVLLVHDKAAQRVNFQACGCNACVPLRAALVKGEPQ